jgi:hypothetical protein
MENVDAKKSGRSMTSIWNHPPNERIIMAGMSKVESTIISG